MGTSVHLDLPNPAFRSFHPSHLNSGKSVIQLLDHRSHLLHAAGETDLLSVVDVLSYRINRSRGSAEAALGEILHVSDGYFSLLSLKTQIMLRYVHQGSSGDGGQYAAGFGSHHFMISGNKDKIGSPGLLHFGPGGRVQVHIFIVALAVGFHN